MHSVHQQQQQPSSYAFSSVAAAPPSHNSAALALQHQQPGQAQQHNGISLGSGSREGSAGVGGASSYSVECYAAPNTASSSGPRVAAAFAVSNGSSTGSVGGTDHAMVAAAAAAAPHYSTGGLMGQQVYGAPMGSAKPGSGGGSACHIQGHWGSTPSGSVVTTHRCSPLAASHPSVSSAPAGGSNVYPAGAAAGSSSSSSTPYPQNVSCTPTATTSSSSSASPSDARALCFPMHVNLATPAAATQACGSSHLSSLGSGENPHVCFESYPQSSGEEGSNTCGSNNAAGGATTLPPGGGRHTAAGPALPPQAPLPSYFVMAPHQQHQASGILPHASSFSERPPGDAGSVVQGCHGSAPRGMDDCYLVQQQQQQQVQHQQAQQQSTDWFYSYFSPDVATAVSTVPGTMESGFQGGRRLSESVASAFAPPPPPPEQPGAACDDLQRHLSEHAHIESNSGGRALSTPRTGGSRVTGSAGSLFSQNQQGLSSMTTGYGSSGSRVSYGSTLTPLKGPQGWEGGDMSSHTASASSIRVRAVISGWKAGTIIGRQGAVISTLRTESRCKITISDDPASSDRILTIVGPAPQVADVLRKVCAILGAATVSVNSTKPAAKGASDPAAPENGGRDDVTTVTVAATQGSGEKEEEASMKGSHAESSPDFSDKGHEPDEEPSVVVHEEEGVQVEVSFDLPESAGAEDSENTKKAQLTNATPPDENDSHNLSDVPGGTSTPEEHVVSPSKHSDQEHCASASDLTPSSKDKVPKGGEDDSVAKKIPEDDQESGLKDIKGTECATATDESGVTPASSTVSMNFTLAVPSPLCGCLIGRGGAQIREFRQNYGVSFSVSSTPLPDSLDRLVHISGPPTKVADSLAQVCRLFATATVYVPSSSSSGTNAVRGSCATSHRSSDAASSATNSASRRRGPRSPSAVSSGALGLGGLPAAAGGPYMPTHPSQPCAPNPLLYPAAHHQPQMPGGAAPPPPPPMHYGGIGHHQQGPGAFHGQQMPLGGTVPSSLGMPAAPSLSGVVTPGGFIPNFSRDSCEPNGMGSGGSGGFRANWKRNVAGAAVHVHGGSTGNPGSEGAGEIGHRGNNKRPQGCLGQLGSGSRGDRPPRVARASASGSGLDMNTNMAMLGNHPGAMCHDVVAAGGSSSTNEILGSAIEECSFTLSTGEVEVHLLVPNDIVGCIIGKGGKTISEIRDTSGAFISITESNFPPAVPKNATSTDTYPSRSFAQRAANGIRGTRQRDRVICIRGVSKNVRTARYLMGSSILNAQKVSGGC